MKRENANPENRQPGGYARQPEIIRCEKKNPRTGNVYKSFCEKYCPERKTGCKPGIKT